MLDAKDVARKVATGCGHTAAVVLPCAGCIEAQMRAWESSVRESAKAELREEFQRLIAERDKAQEEAVRIRGMQDSLLANLARLKGANATLTEANKIATGKIADLQAQLLAEQGMKHAVKIHKAAAR
jgi:predicted nuclease with TOPRIM domain